MVLASVTADAAQFSSQFDSNIDFLELILDRSQKEQNNADFV
jgi:hypothetical protein